MMAEIRKVSEGHEPWEVLYDTVVYKPEILSFHIGRLVSIRADLKYHLTRIRNQVLKRKDEGLWLSHHGGELLTRFDEKHLPRKYIGDAFNEMPPKIMKEVFPKLLLLQLKFIQSLEVEKDVYYSVNLEGLDDDHNKWREVCDSLVRFGDAPVNIELKENTILSLNVLRMLQDVCSKTSIKIYIDDLCSCCHLLPDNEDYMVMLIQMLHPYIKAVKVDYLVMRDIMRLEEYHTVKGHLVDFLWLWESHCDSYPPTVIFESMPQENLRWLRRLEELADGYFTCQYQTG